MDRATLIRQLTLSVDDMKNTKGKERETLVDQAMGQLSQLLKLGLDKPTGRSDTEQAADEKLWLDIKKLGADIGLGPDDGLSSGVIPGTDARPYKAYLQESWGASLSKAMLGDGLRKGPLLGSDDRLPTALPAAPIIEDGRPVDVLRSLLPEGEAVGGRFRYMRQDTREWNAELTAPGELKPVTKLGLEMKDGRVAVVPTLSEPLDRYQFVDAPALAGFVDSELSAAIEWAIEKAILFCTTTLPYGWDGFMVDANVQTQALDTGGPLDSIALAMNKIRRAPYFYPTSGIIMSSDTWTALELLKDQVGRPLLEGPFHDRAARRLFGVPVVISPALEGDVAVLGDFRGSSALMLANGGNISLSFSEMTMDNFARNRVTFRAEARVGLALMRPRAFCKVTLGSDPAGPAPIQLSSAEADTTATDQPAIEDPEPEATTRTTRAKR